MSDIISRYWKSGGWIGLVLNLAILGAVALIVARASENIARGFVGRQEFEAYKTDLDHRLKALEETSSKQLDLLLQARAIGIENNALLKEHMRKP